MSSYFMLFSLVNWYLDWDYFCIFFMVHRYTLCHIINIVMLRLWDCFSFWVCLALYMILWVWTQLHLSALRKGRDQALVLEAPFPGRFSSLEIQPLYFRIIFLSSIRAMTSLRSQPGVPSSLMVVICLLWSCLLNALEKYGPDQPNTVLMSNKTA